MIDSRASIDSLKQLCASALEAFGLSMETQADGPSSAPVWKVLKQDPQSIALKVQCLEKGESKVLVLKYRSAQDKLVSFALTAKLEKLLRSEHNTLTWSDAQAAQSLIPRRWRTANGETFWLSDQSPGDEIQPRGCWSVSEYFVSDPTFNWLAPEPAWSANHARSAGELLAKLHCAGRLAEEKMTAHENKQLASLLPTLPGLLSTAINKGQNAEGLEDLSKASGEHQSSLTEEESAAILGALSQAVELLTTGANCQVLAEERLIVHGDFHPGNVLFKGSTALVAIDLDYAHLEHPLYDLAYALLMFAPTADTADRAASLLLGYCDYFERTAQRPPSFLPTAAQASDIALRQGLVDSPLYQYVIVTASLILLWTLSGPGAKHPGAKSLAQRMVSYIIAS